MCELKIVVDEAVVFENVVYAKNVENTHHLFGFFLAIKFLININYLILIFNVDIICATIAIFCV